MYQCIAGNEEEESQAAAQLVLGGEFTPFFLFLFLHKTSIKGTIEWKE